MDIIYQYFDTIDSTNNWGKQHASTLKKDALTVVITEGQTGGRGRFGRKWVSPAFKNIYITFCYFMSPRNIGIANTAQVLAISAAHMLKDKGFSPSIKWPNDIFLNGKKIGGILCETTQCEGQLCVVNGIGLNINMSQEELNEIDRPATSLLVEGGKLYDVKTFRQALIEKFHNDLMLFFKKGFAHFFAPFAKLLNFLPGQLIRFYDGQIMGGGAFHSLNSDGSINITIPSGEVKKINAGEIF